MDSLRRLVGNLDVLRDSWDRTPFVTGDLGPFEDVFSVDTIQHILDASVPLSSTRMFHSGRTVDPTEVARSRDRNARDPVRFADVDKVIAAVGAGATLVIEEVQSHSPSVAHFAAEIVRDTGYHTDCTAFVTPTACVSVPAHYDSTSVFLRQVYGAKRWRVSAPVEPWPRHRWRPDHDVDTEMVLDIVLRAGECLYIPRGFVHAGETTDMASVHLSIGVSAPAWTDLLTTLLRTAAADTESLRESLPPAFWDGDRSEVFRARRNDLIAVLDKLDWTEPTSATRSDTPYRPHALRAVLRATNGED